MSNDDLLKLKQALAEKERQEAEQQLMAAKVEKENLSFQDAVSDVTPIQNDTVNLQSSTSAPSLAQQARYEAALGETDPVDPNYLSTEYIDLIEPNDWMEYKRDGVQEGVYKKLRLGKYEVEDAIDLHRRTVKEAREDVFHFIKNSLKKERKTLLITHGKGESSTPQAVIKSHVNHWLIQHDDVMAFHSAKPQHGGVGAVYVLLRKSEHAKFKNRENYNRQAH